MPDTEDRIHSADNYFSEYEKQKAVEKVTEQLQDKKRDGEPIGKQLRDITTDKQQEDYDSDEATMRLPREEFGTCIEILNKYANSDKSAY